MPRAAPPPCRAGDRRRGSRQLAHKVLRRRLRPAEVMPCQIGGMKKPVEGGLAEANVLQHRDELHFVILSVNRRRTGTPREVAPSSSNSSRNRSKAGVPIGADQTSKVIYVEISAEYGRQSRGSNSTLITATTSSARWSGQDIPCMRADGSRARSSGSRSRHLERRSRPRWLPGRLLLVHQAADQVCAADNTKNPNTAVSVMPALR